MRKRQRKKNERKYIPVIADEFNLLMMTEVERAEAFEGYKEFRKKYAFRKRYADLRRARPLLYFYPFGKTALNSLETIASRARKNSANTLITLTQNLEDVRISKAGIDNIDPPADNKSKGAR